MASLAGRWKFIKDGSDFLPGIDKLPNSPLVTKLQGFDEDEVFEIEKVHYSSVEEITFTYDDKIKRSYQVGTLNYQTINSSNVSISVVQVCNHDFTEITVLHMGPECGQNSKEIYRLDVNRRHMKVVVEIVTGDGTTLSLIKYLGRSGDSPPVDVSQFQNVVLTLGWKLFEYWPSTILTSCQAKLVRVIKLQATAVGTSDEKYFTEVMWPSQSSAADAKDMDYSRIAVKFGSRNSLGEEVVLYVFQVNLIMFISILASFYCPTICN